MCISYSLFHTKTQFCVYNTQYTIFFYKNVIFWFRLKTPWKIPISASKNFLFLTFSQAHNFLNFSNFPKHISIFWKHLTFYTYIFPNLSVWCINFFPYHEKTSILKQPHIFILFMIGRKLKHETLEFSKIYVHKV